MCWLVKIYVNEGLLTVLSAKGCWATGNRKK